MPYDTYRLYQVERAKSPAEVQHADEQAAWLVRRVIAVSRHHAACASRTEAIPGRRTWRTPPGVTAARRGMIEAS
jgi:hypothetical protein